MTQYQSLNKFQVISLEEQSTNTAHHIDRHWLLGIKGIHKTEETIIKLIK